MSSQGSVDVLVIGAGPAGSMAAIAVARAGGRVLLIDRCDFPRPKACGDALSNTARLELERVGIWERVVGWPSFYRIVEARNVAPNGSSITTSLEHPDLAGGILPRYEFDALLKGYAEEQGAMFEQGDVIAPLLDGGRVNGVAVKTKNAIEERYAQVVIAADGAPSVMASHLCPSAYAPRHKGVGMRGYVKRERSYDGALHIQLLPGLLPGYGWIFPVGEGWLNVGIWVAAMKNRPPLRPMLYEFLSLPSTKAIIGEDGAIEDVRGGALVMRPDRMSRVRRGALLVGDAGGFVNPSTGAGIASALQTGWIAGEVAVEALHAVPGERGKILRSYDRRWQEVLLPALQRGYLIQRFLMTSPDPVNTLHEWFSTSPMWAPTAMRWLAHLT